MRPGPDAMVQSLPTTPTAVNFAARRSGHRRLMEREPEQCTAVLAKDFGLLYSNDFVLERFLTDCIWAADGHLCFGFQNIAASRCWNMRIVRPHRHRKHARCHR